MYVQNCKLHYPLPLEASYRVIRQVSKKTMKNFEFIIESDTNEAVEQCHKHHILT
jgi:hypothetical protein